MFLVEVEREGYLRPFAVAESMEQAEVIVREFAKYLGITILDDYNGTGSWSLGIVERIDLKTKTRYLKTTCEIYLRHHSSQRLASCANPEDAISRLREEFDKCGESAAIIRGLADGVRKTIERIEKTGSL